MREIIPFSKEIVFKTNIASITSISLEHEEKVFDGEVRGDFIILGDYKIHNDTTETELFKFHLPFTTILPENIKKETIKVDIEDFTYEQTEPDVLKVNIDFSVSGEENEEPITRLEDLPNPNDLTEDEKLDVNDYDENITREIEKFLEAKNEDSETLPEEALETVKTEPTLDDSLPDSSLTRNTDETKVDNQATTNEYVTYHIHIVKESQTIEQIVNLYNTNLETIKLYNEIDKIKTGDKLIIPEYLDD